MAQRALLVGIDNYPDPRNNLNSCVADTLAFKALLQDTYGFAAADITLLHNQNATLANVRTGLDTLFAGVQPDDTIVFYESSHGYRFPQDDTLVEVLCLYDGFLHDTELAARTRSLPPNVLTVVLDACHSGGMSKLFFQGDEAQLVRAKVWQPSEQDALREATLYSQVSKFKFFGRGATAEGGAVAKNLLFDPVGVAPAKDLAAASVDLNGALFAACLADQTAAAGSPPTKQLSAFTFGIVEEIDPTISLATLSQRVINRLQRINMRQTPTAISPAQHPELLTGTFVTMRPAGATSGDQPGPAGSDGTGQQPPPGGDPWTWLRDQVMSPS